MGNNKKKLNRSESSLLVEILKRRGARSQIIDICFIGGLPILDKDLQEILSILGDELSGHFENDEPNQYGKKVDDLISIVSSSFQNQGR